jgi:hypothetical protein
MRYKAYPRPIKTRSKPFIRPHQGQERNVKKVQEPISDTFLKHATNFAAGAGVGILKHFGPKIQKGATSFITGKATNFLENKLGTKISKQFTPQIEKAANSITGYLGNNATKYLHDNFRNKSGYGYGNKMALHIGNKFL